MPAAHGFRGTVNQLTARVFGTAVWDKRSFLKGVAHFAVLTPAWSCCEGAGKRGTRHRCGTAITERSWTPVRWQKMLALYKPGNNSFQAIMVM